jgi:hypothetical protein
MFNVWGGRPQRPNNVRAEPGAAQHRQNLGRAGDPTEADLPARGQPADPKAAGSQDVAKAFRNEIAIGRVHALIGKFMLATIFGTPPPADTVAIHDEQSRTSLLMFFARTRMGWTETVVDRPKEHVRSPIEHRDVEK